MTGFRRVVAVPSLETLFVATIALLGLRLGLRPIGDNSFFTHLRTGIDIVDGLGVPRRDPYSFTASGEPWVVQSWLASWVYGLVDALGGRHGLVVLHGALYGLLGWLVASLARTTSPMRTASSALIAAGIGLAYWSPRPLAIALIAMALLVMAVERSWPGWILVPLVWVWANSHGSFVLGGVWLVLLVLTGRPTARRYLGWFVGGCAAAVVNPLGPRLLLFPFALLDKRDNFRRVVEWRPPTAPINPMVVAAVVCVAVTVVVLAWAVVRRRVTVADIVPVAVFLAMGMVAQRNLAPAGIVAAPVLARALRPPVASVPSTSPINRAFGGVLAATAALFVAVALAGSQPFDLDEYPSQRALAAAAGDRLVTTDVVGGYRILLEGRAADVFVDDRYDMYPQAVIRDYLVLLDGDEEWPQVLDRWKADAVLWPEEEELAASLERSRTWRRAFAEAGWVVFVRES